LLVKNIYSSSKFYYGGIRKLAKLFSYSYVGYIMVNAQGPYANNGLDLGLKIRDSAKIFLGLLKGIYKQSKATFLE
jgi:hypothetical protein